MVVGHLLQTSQHKYPRGHNVILGCMWWTLIIARAQGGEAYKVVELVRERPKEESWWKVSVKNEREDP